MDRFEAIVNDFKLLTNVTKYSVLDDFWSPGYDYDACSEVILPIFANQLLILTYSSPQILKDTVMQII